MNSFFIAILTLLTYLNLFPKFNRECFEAWATVTERQPSSCDHIMDQITWINKYFRIDDKPQISKTFFMAGISKWRASSSRTENFKPFEFLYRKGVNLNNYLLKLGLSKVLPESYRALLNSGTTCCSQIPDSDFTYFTELIFHSKTGDTTWFNSLVKKLYWILVEDIRVHPTARLKYNSIYNEQDFNWKHMRFI